MLTCIGFTLYYTIELLFIRVSSCFASTCSQQIDVQLGAGRIELTDISINVSIFEEILPHLSFQLERVHVGKLRVEISYAKLLTESLAFFLDDVSIEIAPSGAHVEKDNRSVGPTNVQDGPTDISEDNTRRLPKATDTSRQKSSVGRQAVRRTDLSDEDDMTSTGGTHKGEPTEGLDLLAHWIEQITSKVKIVVNNVLVRVSAAEYVNGDVGRDTVADDSFLEVQCSSIKWCDETPETSVLLAERPRQGAPMSGGDRSVKRVSHHGGALLGHKVSFVACSGLSK